MDQDEADYIVLGYAGMADRRQSISAELGVPVIDGISAAVPFAFTAEVRQNKNRRKIIFITITI